MRHHIGACTALVVACLLLAGCKDRHDPLKPTVIPIGATSQAH